MRQRLLSEARVARALRELPGWRLKGGRLHRAFRFRDFSEAFGFMARAALEAERLGHHPDWRNAWNTVEVALTTHDAGGLTGKDLALARSLSALAAGTLIPGR